MRVTAHQSHELVTRHGVVEHDRQNRLNLSNIFDEIANILSNIVDKKRLALMNHEILKRVIFDQHQIIRNATIVPRRYSFDLQANYVVTGLRRAGKSTLLYKVVQDLVAEGVDWSRIIYINFEDERLAEFSLEDFQDIPLVLSELSDERGFYVLDEVQNIAGWERFARRMADAGERVFITGSNATMLSSEMERALGGRYLVRHITPYRFDEYLDAQGQPYDMAARYTTSEQGRIMRLFDRFMHIGGFPESLKLSDPREYVGNVYQKVLLGEIVARFGIRNVDALRVLMKKVAETVRSDVSYSKLHNTLKLIGYELSKDSVITYISHAMEAFLIFRLENAVTSFVERAGNPKFYFSDNGLLNLFLFDRDTALLENEIAVALLDVYGDQLRYLKSRKYGIDIDFYVPEEHLAVQVAYSIAGQARDREIANLAKLAELQHGEGRLIIVTMEEEEAIEYRGATIEVVPAWKFLLR